MKPKHLLLVCLAAAAVLCGPAGAADNTKCLMCHGAPGLSRTLPNGKVISLHIDDQVFKQSVHGKRLCTDCHSDMRGQPLPHKTSAAPVKCSGCHFMGNPRGAPSVSPMTEYADSVHGRAVQRGDRDAPKCKNCHGEHDIRPPSDPKSTTYRANIPGMCGKCHGDAGMATRHKIPIKKPFQIYEQSVHGRAVNGQGLIAAAVCTDCHGAHTIKASADPMSTVNKEHVPATCGKCHMKILEEFKGSIHGQAVAKGIKDAPVCTNCHGEHGIQRPTDASSSVYPTHVVATCSKCHENAAIQRRFGMPADRLKTYIGSYHGIANKFGEATVANCATCHGAHAIMPSSDPHSATNKKNLPKTCGKCHPGATANFAKGSVHLQPSDHKDRGVYWVRVFYTGFIVCLIGSFAAYILLDIITRIRKRGRRAQ